jgi:hypothetical protein
VPLGVPIAVFGAFAALFARDMENNVFAQIGLVMLIGLSASGHWRRQPWQRKAGTKPLARRAC